MPRPGRPIGITLLTICQVIGGIADIGLGIILILVYFLVNAFVPGGLPAIAYIAILLFGCVFFGLGILSFILAWGLWSGRGWAWVLSIVVAILGLIFGVLGLVSNLFYGLILEGAGNVIPIILNLIILVYLSTRNVRAFFGRVGGIAFGRQMAPGPPYVPQTQPPYTQPPQQGSYGQQGAYAQSTPWATIACSYCGAPNNSASNFCDNCGNRIR